MAADQFNEQINIAVQFTEKGLTELTAKAEAAINKIANAGLGGNLTEQALPDVQNQLRGTAQAYIAAAKQAIPDNLTGPALQRAEAQFSTFAKNINKLFRETFAAIQGATGPDAIGNQVKEELQARAVASQKAVLKNAALLGATPPNVYANKDLFGTGKTISPVEATQQREALARYQSALIDAADTIRRIAAINAGDGGREAYVQAVAEATAQEKTLTAEIRADLNKRLAGTEAYVQAQAEGSLAERDLASRIKQAINARLAGSTAVTATVGEGEVATAEHKLAANLEERAAAEAHKATRVATGSEIPVATDTADTAAQQGVAEARKRLQEAIDVATASVGTSKDEQRAANLAVVDAEEALSLRLRGQAADSITQQAVVPTSDVTKVGGALQDEVDSILAVSQANKEYATTKEGLVRLYRGEILNAQTGKPDPSLRVKSDPQGSGRFYTTDPAIAAAHSDISKLEGTYRSRLQAVDVTLEELRSFRKDLGVENAFIVSPEVAARARELSEAESQAATQTRQRQEEVALAERELVAAIRKQAETLAGAPQRVEADAVVASARKDLVAKQTALAAITGGQSPQGATQGESQASVDASRSKLAQAFDSETGAVIAAAESTDVQALLQREASNKVAAAMQVAAAKIAEIAAINTEVEGGTAAYAKSQAEAVFGEKLLAQQIATEVAEREAAATASGEYLDLVRRANVAQEQVNAAIKSQVGALSASGGSRGPVGPGGTPLPADWFQRLQASIANRSSGGAAARDAASFAKLPQFLASKAITTGGFAVSGAAFYGSFQAIRTAVDEANKFQVALVELEQEFKAADNAGEFPAAKKAILDLSNQTGVAASQIAGIAQTFKGAFGDTKKTIQETSDALKLGIVSNLPTADITNFVLAIDTAFHTTAQKIGDLALSVFEQTGVSVHEILTGLGTIAPAADEAGLSLKQISVILAVAEQKSGRSAQSIAENFTRVLPAIQKNGTAILDLVQSVPGLDKEFLQLGEDLNSGQTGKFFLDLTNSFEKLNPVAQKTAIELLGGRREAGALIPVLQNAAQVNDLMSKASDNNGKSAQYFAKQLQTLHQQIAILGSEFRNFIGDLLRSGLATGLSDALKFVGFLIGGLQQVETLFKSINKLTHGLSGDAAVGFAAFKGIGLARAAFGGAQRSINLGETTGLNAAAVGLQGSAAALTEAAVALNGSAVAGGASNLGAGLLAGRGGAAAGGAVTDIFGGAATTIPILPSVPILPIALTALAGFALYKHAADDAKKLNAQAASAAKSVVEQYLKAHKEALSSFSDQQNANLQISSSAEAEVVKRAREQVGKDYEKRPITFAGLGVGPSLPHNIVGRFLGGDVFNRGKGRAQDKGESAARKDIEKAFFDNQTKPFLEALKKEAADGGALDIATPRVKDLQSAVKKAEDALAYGVLSGVSNKKLGDLKGKLDDAKSNLKGAESDKGLGLVAIGKAAGDNVGSIIKYLGDGTNKKRNKEIADFIKAESNSSSAAVRTTVARARTILANSKAQAAALVNQNQTETGLDAQKQLYAAGAETADTYLRSLRKRINGLQELQTKSPLTPELKLELAQDLKEENDVLSQLADQANADAEFLAGLTQSGAQLAQTKLGLARAKFAALPKGTPASVAAAKDLLTAQQDAFAQSLQFQSPGDAFQAALKSYKPDSTAVDAIIQDQKDQIAGERAVLEKKRDFYDQQTAKLRSAPSKTRGRDTGTRRQLDAYKKRQQEITDALNALDTIPVLDPAKELNKEVADTANQRVLAANLIRAGDNPVKQAAARLTAAAAQIAIDKEFYGKVLPEDAQAYFTSYNDLLFAKAFAAEQEKERAIQLKIAATHNPEAKAALEQSLADTKKAYAASVAKIPGHEQAAKDAANEAANAQITATNDSIDAANAIAKARLDLLAAMTQDPIQLAQIAIQQADEEARQAAATGTVADQLEAAAHKLQAQHQLAQALNDAQKAYSNFLIAVANFYGDGVKAAELALQQANRELQQAVQQGLGPAEIANRAAAAVTAQRALLDASLAAKEATIDFNLQMKKISSAQAIALYTALLSSKNTVQEQRDLLLKIQSLKESLSQDLQFNLPTDLHLPTLYEARRFNQGGGAQGFAETNATGSQQFNDNRKIEITVNGAQNTQAVVRDVVAAINTPPRNGVRPRIY